MHKRSFVLLPLNELNPKWVHPIKKKGIQQIGSSFSCLATGESNMSVASTVKKGLE